MMKEETFSKSLKESEIVDKKEIEKLTRSISIEDVIEFDEKGNIIDIKEDEDKKV